MPLRKRLVLLVLLALALLLVACGALEDPPGGPDDGPPALVEARKVGFVLLTETGVGGARVVDARGSFRERARAVAAEVQDAPLEAVPGTCHVAGAGAEGSAAPAAATEGTLIGAGASIALGHDGDAWGRLAPDGAGGYRLADAPATLPDAGLVVRIAGGAFPGLEAAVPAAAPVALAPGFDPADVGPDTRFAWEAGDGDGVVLLVGGDGAATFACVAPDDGAFAFDAGTRAALAAAGFERGALQAVGRLAVDAVQEGEALLTLGVLRLEVLDPAAAAALARSPLGAVAR